LALVRCSAWSLCDARRNLDPLHRIRTKCDEQHIVQGDAKIFSTRRLAAFCGAPNQMENVMKSRWWNVFDAMVEIAFKPTAGGYVYRAPSLWPFASGKHYLVNEQHKAMLAGYHRGMFRTLFWLIVVGAGIAGPLAGAFLSVSLWLKLGMSLLIGLAIGIGASAWLVRKVRPIIAGLEPSHERISQGDSFRALARSYSTPTLVGLLVLDVAMLLLAASVFITGPSVQYAIGWLGVLIFGCCTLYTAALFVTKCQNSVA